MHTRTYKNDRTPRGINTMDMTLARPQLNQEARAKAPFFTGSIALFIQGIPLALAEDVLVDSELVDAPVQGPDELEPRLGDVPFLGAQEAQEERVRVVLFEHADVGCAELVAVDLGEDGLDRFELG